MTVTVCGTNVTMETATGESGTLGTITLKVPSEQTKMKGMFKKHGEWVKEKYGILPSSFEYRVREG